MRFQITSGLVLVSDAISALGLGEGIHRLGNMEIELDNNGCGNVFGTEVVCGGAMPLNKCVKLFDEFCRRYTAAILLYTQI
jgi:N-acetylglucosamine-6-phosphate deacetylase